MKFNKIMIMALMFIFFSSIVQGATYISASQVDWVSNDPLLNEKAFLITGVENGGSQSVVFSLDKSNLGSSAEDGGYDLTGTGTIKTKTENYEIEYPITVDNFGYYTLQKMCDGSDCLFYGTKVYSYATASEWCSEFSGVPETNIVVTKHYGDIGYRCWQYEKVGQHAKLGTGQHKFDMYVDVTSPNGQDQIHLTDDMTTGSVDMGNNHHTYAKIVTAGVTFVSPPTPDTEYDAVYTQNQLYLTSKRTSSDFYNFYGYEGIRKVLGDCVSLQKSQDACQYEINRKVAEGMERAYYQGDGTSSITTSSIFDGRMTLSNLPTMYKQPIFSLIIDAEWFGITRPVGNPEIISLTTEDNKLIEGERNYITAEIKNNGEYDASFDFSWDCNGAEVTGSSFEQFNAGETKEIEFQVTGQTSNGCDNANCVLTVTDSENPQISDIKSVNFQFCEQNQCEQEGQTRCMGNTVETCYELNGVLVWGFSAECEDICIMESGYAVCQGQEIVCGDGFCNKEERDKNSDLYCPYPEYTDCPPLPTKPINRTVLIVGSLAGAGLLGAVGLRLKKEGYFK